MINQINLKSAINKEERPHQICRNSIRHFSLEAQYIRVNHNINNGVLIKLSKNVCFY